MHVGLKWGVAAKLPPLPSNKQQHKEYCKMAKVSKTEIKFWSEKSFGRVDVIVFAPFECLRKQEC